MNEDEKQLNAVIDVVKLIKSKGFSSIDASMILKTASDHCQNLHNKEVQVIALHNAFQNINN